MSAKLFFCQYGTKALFAANIWERINSYLGSRCGRRQTRLPGSCDPGRERPTGSALKTNMFRLLSKPGVTVCERDHLPIIPVRTATGTLSSVMRPWMGTATGASKAGIVLGTARGAKDGVLFRVIICLEMAVLHTTVATKPGRCV